MFLMNLAWEVQVPPIAAQYRQFTIILLYFQQVLMRFAGKNVLHSNSAPWMMTGIPSCMPLLLLLMAELLKIPAMLTMHRRRTIQQDILTDLKPMRLWAVKQP